MRRSSKAPVRRSEPNIFVHSSNGKLEVTRIEPRSSRWLGLDPGHHQSALRRMDRGVRLRAAYRRSPRPPHPPRQHPRDEWRELQAQPEPQASNPDGELNRPPNPRLTPWAHRSLPRAPPRRPVEGTPRRTRGPPMDYGDKPAAAKWSLLTPPRWSLFAPPLTDRQIFFTEPQRPEQARHRPTTFLPPRQLLTIAPRTMSAPSGGSPRVSC